MRAALSLLLVALAVEPAPASVAPAPMSAQLVLGQPDFGSNGGNNGGVSAGSLFLPNSAVVDGRRGRLYVADTYNHRVLSWSNADLLIDGQDADLVFGQPDFSSNAPNAGGAPSANSLFAPRGLALDAGGNLYVADSENHRVLEYDAPWTGSTAANRVLGQPDFESRTANNGGVSAGSLNTPWGVVLDDSGKLFVADSQNHRVMEYDAPLDTTYPTADRVLGQADFSSASANAGGRSARSLNTPYAIALDDAGRLYVADSQNHRVLEFDSPLSSDATASRVFGQPSFSVGTPNAGRPVPSASTLFDPCGVEVDDHGRLFVADTQNHRVVVYEKRLENGGAGRVLGQSSFARRWPNFQGPSATSLFLPDGLALDREGRLFVTDFGNHRVLQFASSGRAAS